MKNRRKTHNECTFMITPYACHCGNCMLYVLLLRWCSLQPVINVCFHIRLLVSWRIVKYFNCWMFNEWYEHEFFSGTHSAREVSTHSSYYEYKYWWQKEHHVCHDCYKGSCLFFKNLYAGCSLFFFFFLTKNWCVNCWIC